MGASMMFLLLQIFSGINCRSMCGCLGELFQAVLFQDKSMKEVFSAYAELVCVDATYKQLELRFPLYICLFKMEMDVVKWPLRFCY